jgi:hypothetical protein
MATIAIIGIVMWLVGFLFGCQHPVRMNGADYVGITGLILVGIAIIVSLVELVA